MASVDEVFAHDPRAHLVVGRAVNLDEVTVDDLRAVCERIDAWAATTGSLAQFVVSGDFTETGVDEITGTGVLGVPVLTVEDDLGRWPVELEAVDEAVTRSEHLPWEQLLALLPAGWTTGTRAGVFPYTAATGPLAGVVLAYGVPVQGPDPWALDYRPDAEVVLAEAERAAEPSLALVEVCNTGQHVRAERVYGIEVVARSYWAGPTQRVDLSLAARARHRAELGVLADRAGYYLLCHYDD